MLGILQMIEIFHNKKKMAVHFVVAKENQSKQLLIDMYVDRTSFMEKRMKLTLIICDN